MKILCVSAVLLLSMIAMPNPADAKGCLKGAIVGGVAGHYAGHHGFIGAPLGARLDDMRRENMTVNAIKTNDCGNNERALPKYIQTRWPVCTVIAKPGRIFN